MAYTASPRRAGSLEDHQAQPAAISREDLYRVWVASIQQDVFAQQELRQLVSKSPTVQSLVREFEAELKLFRERHRRPPKRRTPVKPKKTGKLKKIVVRKVKGRLARPPADVPNNKRPLGASSKPLSAWEHMTEGASRHMSIVSGGLPTLGKRR